MSVCLSFKVVFSGLISCAMILNIWLADDLPVFVKLLFSNNCLLEIFWLLLHFLFLFFNYADMLIQVKLMSWTGTLKPFASKKMTNLVRNKALFHIKRTLFAFFQLSKNCSASFKNRMELSTRMCWWWILVFLILAVFLSGCNCGIFTTTLETAESGKSSHFCWRIHLPYIAHHVSIDSPGRLWQLPQLAAFQMKTREQGKTAQIQEVQPY